MLGGYGHCLPRARHQARSGRRHQGAAPRAGRRPRCRSFLSEIPTTARLQHSALPAPARQRRCRRVAVLRDAARHGRAFAGAPRARTATPSWRCRLDHREVADALGYAHGLGVIHRDIKPENISAPGRPHTVADFGIALAVQSAGGARMTQTGLSLDTPQYMPPEQAMGERAIDARSDIYSAGRRDLRCSRASRRSPARP